MTGDQFSSFRLYQALNSMLTQLRVSVSELNELDGQLGDGDLGATVQSLADALAPELENPPVDLGEAFSLIARTIGRTSGSSFSGVVMAGMLAASRQTRGHQYIPWKEVPNLLQVAVTAMQASGGAVLGDKTIIDALSAVEGALRDRDPNVYVEAATSATEASIVAFRGKPSGLGRARVAGERSIGLDDPGMVALKRALQGLA